MDGHEEQDYCERPADDSGGDPSPGLEELRGRDVTMGRYDDYPQSRGRQNIWGNVLAFLIVGSFIFIIVYALFVRPDSIGDVIDSGAVRERYEKLLGERDGEIADLRSQLAESQRNLEAQRAMTTDEENAYYEMKSKADSLESANSELRTKVSELSAQNKEKQARIDETQKGWHLSLGGMLGSPVDALEPSAEVFVEGGRDRWRVVTGVGLDSDMDFSVKAGFSWSFF